jgi:hypothetical protein
VWDKAAEGLVGKARMVWDKAPGGLVELAREVGNKAAEGLAGAGLHHMDSSH